MPDHTPRLFSDAAGIVRIGEGLLARALPKADWTHEAHLAASLWLCRDREDVAPETDLPGIIAAYNESMGGVNSDTEGYHETITQTYVRAVRDHLAERPVGESLLESVNALLISERGRREWPLRFYSQERLFSTEARRSYVMPDLS